MVQNKAKQLSKKGEVNTTDTTDTWLDLPELLHYNIQRGSLPLFDWARSGDGVVKSWKHFPKRCPTVGNSAALLPQLCETTDDQRYIGGYHIPIWDSNVPCKKVALSYSYQDNYVLLAVTGIRNPAFVYYKRTGPWDRMVGNCWLKHFPEEHKWVNEDYTLIDPHCSRQQYMKLCNAVGLDGKFYAISLQGTLAVIEEVDSHMVITRVSKTRAVPSVFSRHFREYLAESCGEILLIFLISTKLITVVDKVQIFRLQVLPELRWKKIDSLGDRAVVAGANTCYILDKCELKCKGNRVYYTNCEAHGWWVYDMARGDISKGT